MWLKVILLVIVLLLIAFAGAIIYGSSQWKTSTIELRTRLEKSRLPNGVVTYDAREVETLPTPVRRYFRKVLKDGQPIVSTARLRHEGEFNMGEKQAKWGRFTSSQIAVMRRPGFDWDGRIAMAPGLNIFVHDAYVAGEGILHVALLGLMTIADIRGTPEMAEGELMRFLAEAVWYPTALLPSQGVWWEAIDDVTARATLRDSATIVSLDFHFDAEGLISKVRASARHRTVNGALVATPWQGQFWEYEIHDGIRIPLEGEVAWELPEGLWPYWRGRVTDVSYDFAQ